MLKPDFDESITQIKQNLRISLIGSIILLLVSIWVLHQSVPVALLIGWAVLHTLLIAARIVATNVLVSAQQQPTLWRNRKRSYVLIMTLTGLAWGAISIVAAVYATAIEQVVIALIIAGLTAGAVSTLTPIFSAFLGYFLAAVIPIFVGLALSENDLLVQVSPIMLLYIVVVYLSGKKLNSTITNNIYLARSLAHLNDHVMIQKQQSDDANRAKSTFLSSMSHELRTPLNSILGFSQLLQMDDLTSQQQQNIQQILTAGEHLLVLIDDVLDLSKVESGHNQITMEPLSIQQAISHCIEMLKPLAEKKHITIINHESEMDGWVNADSNRLHQVIINLLSNAIKYNKMAGRVTIRCQPESANKLKISVLDSGFGISPDKHHLLFSAFHRLGKEGSNIEGSGIGLFLSKRLMELMGGEIGFNRQLSEGSEFWITLQRCDESSETTSNTGALSV